MMYPKEYCVFDFETTGLHPPEAKILEIGALKVTEANPEGEQFTCLINWGAPVPEVITKITGITTEMVTLNGIDPLVAFTKFKEFCAGLPLVGHNIFRFDLGFLKEFVMAYGNLRIEEIDATDRRVRSRCVDTAVLFKAMELGPQHAQLWCESHRQFADRINDIKAYGVKYNVGVCCDKLGIDKNVEQHRAMGDVILTHEIYKKLCLTTATN